MQGQQSKRALYYRCRFPAEHGLANKLEHPRNIYLAEREMLSPLDQWLSRCLATHRFDETATTLHNAQPDLDTTLPHWPRPA